jgi:hypothetical protein
VTEPRSPEPRRPARVVTFDGVIALLLGLITLGFGILLVLRPIQGGLLFAPIGVGAAGFGLRGLRGNRLHAERVLPLIGAVAGLVGAVLVVIGLLRAGLGV